MAQGELWLSRLTQDPSCENVSLKRLSDEVIRGPHHPCAGTHMEMHYTHSLVTVDTNTLFEGVQTTSDCQCDKPNNQSAHSRLRSVFGYFAERASPTGYEPQAQEQFEDFTWHNFASSQGDSMTSSNSSFSGSMTEVVAPTIFGTELYDLAPRDRSRKQESGWSSTENPHRQECQTVLQEKEPRSSSSAARHSQRTGAAAAQGGSKKSPC